MSNKSPVDREKVFEVINQEREYQDNVWGSVIQIRVKP